MNNVVTTGAALTKGTIRTLSPREMRLLKDHLLRLDPESRRNRFNGVVDDSFIARYTERCASDGTIVVAYLTNGDVHGAAELHQPDERTDNLPEMAFSVEDAFRRQGLGSVLFQQVLETAARAGFTKVRITTGSQNEAMKALARKFGAKLTFGRGESTGVINLKSTKQPTIHAAWREAQKGAGRTFPFVAPTEMARASIAMGRWYWSEVFRALDSNRSA